MTLDEFLEELSQVDDETTMRLSPGPFSIRVGEHDARAALVLRKLDGQMEPDTKLREAEAILMWNALKAMLKAANETPEDEWSDEAWYTDEVRDFLYAWWWLVFWASQETDKIQD